VRTLDADVDDPEVLAPGRGQRGFADRLVREPAAQAADRADDPQDDVHRMPRLELGPRLVRRTSPAALRLAAGAASLPSALLEQRQLLGIRAPLRLATRSWLPDLHAA